MESIASKTRLTPLRKVYYQKGNAMNKILCVVFILLSLLCTACSTHRTYEDGYSAGYDAGFKAGLNVSHDSEESSQPKNKDQAEENESLTGLSPQPEPENGYIFEVSNRENVAPLTVETGGTGGYYIVLDPLFYEWSGGSFERTQAELDAKYTNIRFYVHAGSTIDILVPLGEYEIYYATGETWYGLNNLFGSDTIYYKCDDTFLFSTDSDNYYGWTLQLEPVLNGNLDTDVIDPEDFPK